MTSRIDESGKSITTPQRNAIRPTKIRAGWYEYRGHTLLEDNKVNTRRAGALVEWKIYSGIGLDRSFVHKTNTRRAAIEWIDRQGESYVA